MAKVDLSQYLIFPVAGFSDSIAGKISQGPQPPQAVPKHP